jgi:hypothetical protein
LRGIVFRRAADTTILPKEVIPLSRIRYLLFLVVALLLTAAATLQGKSAPVDLLIQSTTDVFGELAPCG